MKYRDQLRESHPVPDLAMVAWNISSNCNLSCAHCYLDSDHLNGAQLKQEQLFEIVDRIVEAGVRAVFLAGGEPLLHPQIEAVVRRLCAGKVSVYLNTNGLLLSRTRCKALIEAGIEGIIIGMDGVDQRKYEDIRGHGTYLRAIAGLRNAQSLGIAVEVDFTLNRWNRAQLVVLAKWADEMELSRVTIKRYVPRPNRGHDLELRLNSTLLRSSYYTFLAAVPNPTTRNGCKLFAHDPLMLVAKAEKGILREEDILREDCNAGAYARGWIGVNAQGGLSPCPVITEIALTPQMQQSWLALIDCQQFTTVRDTIPEKCLSCAHVKYCRGGCRASKLRLGLSLNQPDPCCWIFSDSKNQDHHVAHLSS